MAASPSSLGRASNLPQEHLDAAAERTFQQGAAEAEAAWRSSFLPHAILDTANRIPQPIFAAAVSGAQKKLRIELPLDVPPLRWPQHVRAHLPDGLPGYGRVLGFTINYAPDRAIRFDRTAQPLETLSRAVRTGLVRSNAISASVMGTTT